jgi:hypothetical protein
MEHLVGAANGGGAAKAAGNTAQFYPTELANKGRIQQVNLDR